MAISRQLAVLTKLLNETHFSLKLLKTTKTPCLYQVYYAANRVIEWNLNKVILCNIKQYLKYYYLETYWESVIPIKLLIQYHFDKNGVQMNKWITCTYCITKYQWTFWAK